MLHYICSKIRWGVCERKRKARNRNTLKPIQSLIHPIWISIVIWKLLFFQPSIFIDFASQRVILSLRISIFVHILLINLYGSGFGLLSASKMYFRKFNFFSDCWHGSLRRFAKLEKAPTSTSFPLMYIFHFSFSPLNYPSDSAKEMKWWHVCRSAFSVVVVFNVGFVFQKPEEAK